MNQIALEEQRLTMLKRLNTIDAELSGLNKNAIARAVIDGTRGLDRRDVKPRGNQIKNNMLTARQNLVKEKNDLTTEYVRVKSLLKTQPQQEGLVVKLLRSILTQLGGTAAKVNEKTGMPVVRNTE